MVPGTKIIIRKIEYVVIWWNISLAQRVGRVRRRILPGKGYNPLQTPRVVDHEVARKLPSLLVCSTLSSCPIGCLVSGYVPVGIFLKVDFESILHCVTSFGSWGMTLCQNAKSCKISIAVKEFRPLFLHHVKHNLVRWWFSGHHLSEWARIWPNFASCLAIL